MDTTPSNVAKTAPNEPRDLLARLYREIGISAVAAALEPAALAELAVGVDAKPKPATRTRRNAKAA
jgi:hypothetical protein